MQISGQPVAGTAQLRIIRNKKREVCMKVIGKISDAAALAAKIAVVPASCGFFLCMIWNVLARFVFNKSFMGVEDYSQTCFVWTCFLGASLVFRDRTDIAITAVVKRLPGPAQKAVRILVDLITLGFLAFVCYQGTFLAYSTRNTPMVASHMSQAVLYGAMPTGTLLMVIHAIRNLWETMAGLRPVKQ